MNLLMAGFDQFVPYWPALAMAMGVGAAGWAHRSSRPSNCHVVFFLMLVVLGIEVLCGVGSRSCDWSHAGLWLGLTIVGGVIGPNGSPHRRANRDSVYAIHDVTMSLAAKGYATESPAAKLTTGV